MKKNKIRLSLAAVLILAFSIFTNISSTGTSTNITNLEVIPVGSFANITWDLIPETLHGSFNGYAVTWANTVGELAMKPSISIKHHVSKQENSLQVSGKTFSRDRDYYFRVFAYNKADDSRQYKFLSGSKILKWRISYIGTINSEYIEPNDPVLETTQEEVIESQSFGRLQVLPYDVSAQLHWSTPSLASHEYDDIKIFISENDDLSDPVGDIKVGRNVRKIFIKGLKPNTNYYAVGYYYTFRNNAEKFFGKGMVLPFKTSSKFTESQFKSYERAIDRLRESSGLGKIYNLSSEIETTTSSTSTSTYTPVSSTNMTDTETINRINEIKRQILSLQSELRKLEKKVNKVSSSYSSSKNTTSSSSKKLSLRERLLKILNIN